MESAHTTICTCCKPSLEAQVAAYPAHLSQFGQHYHDGRVVLPQHPPKILCGLSQRSLGGNVGLLLPAIKQTTMVVDTGDARRERKRLAVRARELL